VTASLRATLCFVGGFDATLRTGTAFRIGAFA